MTALVIVAPDEQFEMTCGEDHTTVVSHRQWHEANLVPCATRGCDSHIDLVHARRHANCPCDEV